MATRIKDLGKRAVTVKGWIESYKWLVLRRVSQIGILALFMAGPVMGVWVLKGNLASSLVLGAIPMTDPLLILQMLAAGFFGVLSTTLIGAAVVVALYVVVGGRAYCSWVCPVNVVTDAAHWLRRHLDLRRTAKFNNAARYWVLGVVLLAATVSGSLAYEMINPVSMLHRGIIYGMGLGWIVIFAVFLFDLFFARHGWCGHLCPMGALYGLIGRASIIRVRADAREKCDDCMECYEVCPEPHVIPPALKKPELAGNPVIFSGDCTNCGRCIDICSERVFAFGLRFPTAKTHLTSEETAGDQTRQRAA